jgi:DNA-binding beta-propeller fold protein YncE
MAGSELAVVVNQYSNSVTLMRVDDVVEPLAEILVGVSPQTVSYDSDRRVVWVTNQGESKITVLSVPDAASGEAPQLLGAIDTREAPYGVLIGSKFAYVSAQRADRVQVFDKYNYTLLAEVAVTGSPRGMALSEDGRWLYVSHFDSGIISKVETSTFTCRR